MKPNDFSHLKVLVAEDNLVNQVVIKGVLKKFDIQPAVAKNGVEAVDLFRNAQDTPFDLILMDCEMPELDGWEATRRIRTMQEKSNISLGTKIIALSAHVQSSEQERSKEVGMDDYLAKPIAQAELLEAFKLHFSGNEDGSGNQAAGT